MRGVVARMLAFGLAVGVGAMPGLAQGPAARRGDRLAAELDALGRRPDAHPVADDALAQAARALDRAKGLEAQDEAQAADRARRIAQAALQLAGRQVALAQERAALRGAMARLAAARKRAETARAALARARAQHDRAAAAAVPAQTGSDRAPPDGEPDE